MITARELSKTYGAQEVLQNLSFTANPAEITLLLGENGVGKTTTMRILSGLIRPDRGAAYIAGHSIVGERERAQSALSFLPQGIVFHPKLSCEAVLGFYADMRGVDRGAVAPMLDRVGLTDQAKKPAGQLSGGLRQRLGLGVLLLPDAPVLLLDEPGLSLDPKWRMELQQILRQEVDRGKTVLVTTHLLAEWEGVAHRSLLCQRGGAVSEIDPFRLREAFAASAQSVSPARETTSYDLPHAA